MGAVESNKKFICCLCIITAIIECCLKGNMDFAYKINMGQINNINIKAEELDSRWNMQENIRNIYKQEDWVKSKAGV